VLAVYEEEGPHGAVKGYRSPREEGPP
jgi:hypothetical protein